MREVKDVSPFRCRVWENHGRLEEYLTVESCQAEIESFAAHGQLIPVLARRVRGDGTHDFEVVCGSRRLFVSRHLNVPLQIEIREFTDREAVIALEIENCHRKDVSAYERGRGFARWLAEGYFESQDDIARTLKISASQVSKLLKIGRLPSVIVSAFGKPIDICEVWGLGLHSMWEDESKRPFVAAKARRLTKNNMRLSPHEVYEQLIASPWPKEERIAKSRDEVVMGTDGMALFRVKHHRESVALVINKQRISLEALDQIKVLLAEFLQDESAQVLEPATNAEVNAAVASYVEHAAPASIVSITFADTTSACIP